MIFWLPQDPHVMGIKAAGHIGFGGLQPVIVLQVVPFLYSYQCPLLKGQSPKQLTNQQTCMIPVNPNNPGGGQYTQNYPLRDTTCKFLFYLPFLIL